MVHLLSVPQYVRIYTGVLSIGLLRVNGYAAGSKSITLFLTL